MRNILKKNNLIPGFIRYEKKNNNLYAIDYYKKIIMKSTPRFFHKKKILVFLIQNIRIMVHVCLIES